MEFIFEHLPNKNLDGSLQIMYTIHGSKDLEEIELTHLDGHGNGAVDHTQLVSDHPFNFIPLLLPQLSVFYLSGPWTSSSSSSSAAALTCIDFRECATPVPLYAGIRKAEGARHPGARLLIVTKRSRWLALKNHRAELKDLMEEYGSVEVGLGCGDGVCVSRVW
ncbi:hypothetical protein D9615_009148 [Tricholomella constricta]|uniref:Uncharacterized protein n=1 Tax=Tricholomella constricta TaxID=117010 RepID=A0A8H5H225_9AGAR|nr:hypothetical protein D9615_009148 [Tricholomella constricta]